jgi:hypothetical protein
MYHIFIEFASKKLVSSGLLPLPPRLPSPIRPYRRECHRAANIVFEWAGLREETASGDIVAFNRSRA